MSASDLLRTSASGTELFERGCRLLEKGNPEEAFGCLEKAHHRHPEDARIRSQYGLCLGLVEHRFEKALELCRSAVKQEFFNPDLYLNLALVHLNFGFKSEAIRNLRRGQMIDPANQRIADLLAQLGERRSQVLGFLPRRHPLNRLLGRARWRIGRALSVAA
jgi:tetratricopeptide (TPR) repeat protein